jgi:hypothetical protein
MGYHSGSFLQFNEDKFSYFKRLDNTNFATVTIVRFRIILSGILSCSNRVDGGKSLL